MGSTRSRARPLLTIRFPSETAHLVMIADLARQVATCAGFAAEVSEQVALAVDEAATNVIEHAYQGQPDADVEIRFRETATELRIELHDTGLTVDPRQLPRVDLGRYAKEKRSGGLGVHLMTRLMDSVTYRRLARRNVCCLIKRKAAGA